MEMYRKVKNAHFDLSLKLAQRQVFFYLAGFQQLNSDYDRCTRILVKRGCNPRDISTSLVQNALHASHITRLRGLRT